MLTGMLTGHAAASVTACARRNAAASGVKRRSGTVILYIPHAHMTFHDTRQSRERDHRQPSPTEVRGRRIASRPPPEHTYYFYHVRSHPCASALSHTSDPHDIGSNNVKSRPKTTHVACNQKPPMVPTLKSLRACDPGHLAPHHVCVRDSDCALRATLQTR